MPSFTGNKYPEELRALRAQYPNTQFDSHGRVVGGMPLSQYNTQPAAIIPASVRTYSQFDPATGTWIRHTNGAVSPVQGLVPTDTPGIFLRPKQQSRSSRQVMRPLPRDGQRTVKVPKDVPMAVSHTQTPQNIPMAVSHVQLPQDVPLAVSHLQASQNIPLAVSHAQEVHPVIPDPDGAIAAEIGQSVPLYEKIPDLDLNGYRPVRKDGVDLVKAAGGIGASVLAPVIIGGSLMYGPTAAGAALGLGRTALSGGLNLGRTALTSGLGAAAKVLPKNMTSRVSSWANSAVDASKSLFNKLGGFLRRPATPEEAAAQAQQAAYQQAANIGAKVRAGQYYTY